MNGTAAEFDIEYCTGRLLAGLAKVEYLANVIGDTVRKQAGQKPEFAILSHEIRTNSDIIDDYIQKSIRIINELRETLQNE